MEIGQIHAGVRLSAVEMWLLVQRQKGNSEQSTTELRAEALHMISIPDLCCSKNIGDCEIVVRFMLLLCSLL